MIARLMGVLLVCTAAAAAEERTPLVAGPWQEAVISVSDLDRTAAFFLDVAGYETRTRGTVDRALLDHWQFPDAATAEDLVLAAPWADAGHVRLVRFDGVAKVPIRPGARPWDTGGWFSLMLRARDLDTRYAEAIGLGWWTESDVVQVAFDTSDLKTVIFTGPDGVYLSVYERLTPPLDPFWPDFPRMTQPFNAMQTVRDFAATYRFYAEVMGLGAFYKGEPNAEPVPTYSNFSIPTGLTTEIPLHAGIMWPTPGETGRVEFIDFVGLEGRDYGPRALPPNLGILALRFPVADIAAAARDLAARGWPLTFPVTRTAIAPYGTVDILTVRTPDGAMIELFAPAR